MISSDSTMDLTQGTDYNVSDRVVTLTNPTSLKIQIYRETTTKPLVNWEDASVLHSKDMSLNDRQVLHIQEEYNDHLNEELGTGKSFADQAKEAAEEAKNYKDIAIAGQLQSDWNEEDTSAKSFIKGKPTELLEEMQEHIENLLKKVDYITPQVFGAVGDGETDDTIALKKAIQYAHEKSLKIYIPQGTYCISEPLHIYENQYIFGAGSTNTKIKSSMESTNSSAIIILDRTPDYKFSYGENYTIKDITLTSVNKVAYGIYAEKAAPYIKFSHLSIHTVQTGISIPDTWMSTIDNTDISGIAIGIQLRSQGTSLHLENIYIMTPTKYGYDIHGLSYSEWSNVGCDWATEDAIPYNFSFGNVTINGLGCESEKCKICIKQSNSTLNITGATLYFPKTDTGNSVFFMNGSILNITNANISLAGMLPENNTAKVFNLATNNIIKIKNMSYPNAIKERLSLNNDSSFVHIEDYTSNHSSLSEIPHLGDTNTFLSFFRNIVPYNRKMTTIYGGVNGRNLQLSDEKDISWSPAPKCGDILLNSDPKAGIAFMQCVSDSTLYTLKGTVTSIDGNVVTLSDWGFADDAMTKFATNRGTTINEKGYFNNVSVTSISAEDKQIVLKNAEDTKQFVVGSSITYKNPLSYMRDCKYKVVQQVLADTSTARPTFPAAGMMYFDTTLNKPIWFNGKNWVDVNGNKV